MFGFPHQSELRGERMSLVGSTCSRHGFYRALLVTSDKIFIDLADTDITQNGYKFLQTGIVTHFVLCRSHLFTTRYQPNGCRKLSRDCPKLCFYVKVDEYTTMPFYPLICVGA